jgi:hypothetical protein
MVPLNAQAAHGTTCRQVCGLDTASANQQHSTHMHGGKAAQKTPTKQMQAEQKLEEKSSTLNNVNLKH